MSVLTLVGQSVAMFVASMVVGMLPLLFKGRMSGELSVEWGVKRRRVDAYRGVWKRRQRWPVHASTSGGTTL